MSMGSIRDKINLFEDDAAKTAIAELEADPKFHKLNPREQNFIANFLTSVTGDRFADGANFQSDMKSYGYKNITGLLAVYNNHYPRFSKLAKPGVQEGVSAELGKLETYLESVLKELGWKKPDVHAKEVRDGVKADLEDWSTDDPSSGPRGGKVGSVTFVLLKDDLGLRWEWEDTTSTEKQNDVEAIIIKNKSAIHDLVKEIAMS